MKRSRFWKKTVSMLLVCAMLCGTLAQYAIAEEDLGTEVVVDMEEVTAPTEEVTAGTAEVPEVQDATLEAAEEPNDSATEETNAPAADGQDVPEATDGETDDAETADTANAEDAADTPAEVPAEPETAGEEDAQTTDIVADEASDDTVVVDEEPSVTINEIEVVGGNSGIATIAQTTDDNIIYDNADFSDGVKITGMNTNVTGGSLKIPETIGGKKVTEIAAKAFANMEFNGTLELPRNLEIIGESAFENCHFKGSLTLYSTTSIGARAFAGCTFTGSLNLPEYVEIGEGAFEGCSGFTGTLKIPALRTEISASAFKGCSGIEKLEFLSSSNVVEIGDSAFEGCSGLKGTLALPSTVTTVGKRAFASCTGFTQISGFGSLTSIGESVFEGCSGLDGTLTIPEAIKEIGKSAFKGCTKIDYLTLSNGLTSIGASAFEGCTELKSNSGNTIFALPSSLKEIGDNAFYGCNGMAGTLDLSTLSSATIGYHAFYGCDSFSALKLPDSTAMAGMTIHNQAIFESIRMDEAETPIEVQAGDLIDLPKVYAGNGKLELLNQIKWSYQSENITVVGLDDDRTTPEIPVWTAWGSGTVTIIATAYNGITATKKVVITPTSSTTDTIAPVVKSVSAGEKSVWKPGTIKLSMDLREENSGIVTLSGYFVKSTDAAQQIPFTCDWSKERKFSGTVSEIPVNVPAGAAVGDYYLGGVTVKDGVGNETSYTYNPSTRKWKNGNGNIVEVNGSVNISVLDRFDRGNYNTSIYITGANSYFENVIYPNLIVTYDADNHTVLKSWLQKAKDASMRLLLSSDMVEWSVMGAELSAASADFDCLITLENFDAIRYGNSEETMMVNLPGIGALPGKASVRIRADQMNGLYDQTNTIFVYSMNADATLTKQEIPVSYVQGNGQFWYEFQVTNATPAKLVLSAYELSLTPARSVTSIKLNKTTLGLRKGKTYTLKATVGPDYAENKEVTWKSSNTKVATVNAKGKITTKRYGKVTITATAKDGSGVVGKCVLTVGYRIKYNLNGGKNNKKNPKIYYKTAFKLRKPTRTGYTFKGWYTDKNFKNRIKKIPKSYKRNLTLYAKWKKK